MCVCVHEHVNVCACMCIYIYICVCVCVCVCASVHVCAHSFAPSLVDFLGAILKKRLYQLDEQCHAIMQL